MKASKSQGLCVSGSRFGVLAQPQKASKCSLYAALFMKTLMTEGF